MSSRRSQRMRSRRKPWSLGDRALNDVTEDAQTGAVSLGPLRDHGADAALPEQAAALVGVVAAVGQQRVGAWAGPGDLAPPTAGILSSSGMPCPPVMMWCLLPVSHKLPMGATTQVSQCQTVAGTYPSSDLTGANGRKDTFKYDPDGNTLSVTRSGTGGATREYTYNGADPK